MSLATRPARQVADAFAEPALGERLVRLRKERGLSLTALASLASVSPSTISRIENGKLSPTYSVLSRLCEALGHRLSDMIGQTTTQDVPLRFAPGCRAVTRAGQGMRHQTPHGLYEFLGTELATKQMEVAVIEPVPDHAGRSLDSHSGQELIYVLDGPVIFYMQHYAPLSLNAGDSVYFDATTLHAVYGTGGPARILSLTSRDGPMVPTYER